jgi:hypothetical protein
MCACACVVTAAAAGGTREQKSANTHRSDSCSLGARRDFEGLEGIAEPQTAVC